MTMLEKRPRKTVDDYMELPDDVRAELIDGEFYYMTPAPRLLHQQTVFKLTSGISAFVETRGLGMVVLAPFDVHLPSGDVVQPDVLFVAKANEQIVGDHVAGAPDLVAEVLSPSNNERDRLVKRDLYARNGVREYWIVDGDERSVEVLMLKGCSYESHGFFLEPAVVTSTVLPDLALAIDQIMPPVS